MISRRIFLGSLAAVLAGTGCVAANTAPDAAPLGEYLGVNRVLLIFAPVPEAFDVRRQYLEFQIQERQPLRDRDVVVLEVGRRLVTERRDLVSPQKARVAPRLSADDLRAFYDLGFVEFGVILVGKDGTEKLRSSDPVPATTVFETIDAMPMRQREMRED